MNDLPSSRNDSSEMIIRRSDTDRLFFEIYRNYQGLSCQIIFNIIQDKEAAEDIVQDQFLKLWQRKETINDIKNIPSYIAVLSRNSAIDYVRRRKQEKIGLSNYKQTRCASLDLTECLNQKETERLLQLAIQDLAPRRKIAFILVWLEGRSRDQVSKQLKVSPNTVKNLIRQARHDIQVFFTTHTGMKRVSVLKIMKNVWCKGKTSKVA